MSRLSALLWGGAGRSRRIYLGSTLRRCVYTKREPSTSVGMTAKDKSEPKRCPMHPFLNVHWWALTFSAIVQFVLFLRWLYRRIRDDQITRIFVRDMATNHLPHIYDLLLKICEEQGIDRAPPPHIRWIDLTGPPH